MGAAGYITYELIGQDPEDAIEYIRYLDTEPKLPTSIRLPIKTLSRLDALAGLMKESRARAAALCIDSAIDNLVRGSMAGPLEGLDDYAETIEAGLRHAYEAAE